MSQPGTATTRIGTRPKNATQHPGHILTAGVGKRRTATQKAADDQRDREAKEASEKALQESYQRIATLQAQMQANQDAARMDAPKPKRPRARPVEGCTGLEDLIGTKGRGREYGCEDLVAGVNAKHPETRIQILSSIASTLGSMSKLKQL